MSCDDSRILLGEYLTGALLPDERATVRLHLEACRACSQELEELRMLDRELQDLAPVRRPGRRFAGWAGAAGAAAAILVLSLVGVRLLVPTPCRVGDGELVSANGGRGRGETVPYGVSFSSPRGAALELPDGSFVESGAEARFTLVAPRTFRLDGGDAYFDVRRNGDPFRVLTPAGEVEVLGTRFVVRIGESTMKKTAAGVAVGVMVLSGAVLLRPSDPDLASAPTDLRAGEQALMRADALRKITPARFAGSTSGVEAALRTLEQQQALLESDLSAFEGKVNPYEGLHPQTYLQTMEELLDESFRHSSLDRAAIEKAKQVWMRIWREILEAESASAKITRDGSSVRIEIPPMPARVEEWRKEWARARPVYSAEDRKLNETLFFDGGDPDRLSTAAWAEIRDLDKPVVRVTVGHQGGGSTGSAWKRQSLNRHVRIQHLLPPDLR
jgi:hypothetical protein